MQVSGVTLPAHCCPNGAETRGRFLYFDLDFSFPASCLLPVAIESKRWSPHQNPVFASKGPTLLTEMATASFLRGYVAKIGNARGDANKNRLLLEAIPTWKTSSQATPVMSPR